MGSGNVENIPQEPALDRERLACGSRADVGRLDSSDRWGSVHTTAESLRNWGLLRMVLFSGSPSSKVEQNKFGDCSKSAPCTSTSSSAPEASSHSVRGDAEMSGGASTASGSGMKSCTTRLREMAFALSTAKKDME